MPLYILHNKEGKASAVHFATHGVYNSIEPGKEFYRIVSGALVLADSENEQLLWASEIEGLKLENTHFVVLSACNTNRGSVSSDGVASLSRAFLTAGSTSVVASLWSIPDQITADLMIEFYKQWNLSKAITSIPQTLRNAMLAVLHSKNNSPLYWAGFVAMSLDV